MKKKFLLSGIVALLSTNAFSQIVIDNDGYSVTGCAATGNYNTCYVAKSGSSSSSATVSNGTSSAATNGISGGTYVNAGSSVVVNSPSSGYVNRPSLTDSNSSAGYISSTTNTAINTVGTGSTNTTTNYNGTTYAYNTSYNGKRYYKVVSCDEYNTKYYNKNGNYGSNLVNPNNRKGSQQGIYREDNRGADIEFFDPNTKKSLGWGGALIAKQEVWVNNKLDHYEGDSISGTKYAMGQPYDGWNLVQQAGQCEYAFDPIYQLSP
jgi:hypothetical protein